MLKTYLPIIMGILYLVTSTHSKLGALFLYDPPYSTAILKCIAGSGISNAMYIPSLQRKPAETIN
jgi:hypothetical protein